MSDPRVLAVARVVGFLMALSQLLAETEPELATEAKTAAKILWRLL